MDSSCCAEGSKIYNSDPSQDHEYLPIAGIPAFNNAAQGLILGQDSVAITENRNTKDFDLKGMTETLKSAPKGSIVVLHNCAHKPTGVNPTEDD
ncbi:aspartate transaminase [Penicillium angulare]|uniref:aspartate transaminase n=1 Tax=Penicillium angulare TaxID=116970 RepID=UPI002541AA68|nr:aspartate transaminase [Penicillium angulare]KAJ5273375.1 aspartate transaminase [Penicillium angulare]